MNYFFQEGPLSQEITIVTGADPEPPQLSLENDTVTQGEVIRVSIDRNGSICLQSKLI
jgi:hypothetical protein